MARRARGFVLALVSLCASCGDDDDGDPAAPDAAAPLADGAPPADAATIDATVAECGGTVEVTPLTVPGDVSGSLAAGSGAHVSPGCGGEGAEVAYEITVDRLTALEVTVDASATTIDPVIYLRGDCEGTESEIACHGGVTGSLVVDRLEPGTHYLMVDSAGEAGGAFALSVAAYVPEGEPCEIGASACWPDQICGVTGPGAAVCQAQQCDPLWTPEVRATGLFGAVMDTHRLESSCRADEGAAESVYRFDVDRPFTELRFEVVGAGVDTPTLSLRASSCGDPAAEVACSAAGGPLVIADPVPGPYYLVVEGAVGDPFRLLLRASLGVGESCTRDLTFPCIDGAVCTLAGYTCVTGQCSDGLDTDGDGLSDYPFEPGCDSADDPDEQDACRFQGSICGCVDGNDNDGDGTTDYPADADCESAADRFEGGLACANEADDDGDGRVDWAADPGCTDPSDTSEADDCPDGPGCPRCADGIDNNGDGRIDWPADPMCPDPRANGEAAPAECPNPDCTACFNGRDDDYDGTTDHPDDPDCREPMSYEGVLCQHPEPYLPVTGPVLTGTTVGARNQYNLETASWCYDDDVTGSIAPDVTYWLHLPGRLNSFTTDSSASSLQTIVGVFDGDCYWWDDCEQDPSDRTTQSYIAQRDVFIVVDGTGQAAGEYSVTVHGIIAPGEGCDESQIASGLLECEAPTTCVEGICR